MRAVEIDGRELVALAAFLAFLWLAVRGRRWLDRRDAAARLADRRARDDARFN